MKNLKFLTLVLVTFLAISFTSCDDERGGIYHPTVLSEVDLTPVIGEENTYLLKLDIVEKATDYIQGISVDFAYFVTADGKKTLGRDDLGEYARISVDGKDINHFLNQHVFEGDTVTFKIKFTEKGIESNIGKLYFSVTEGQNWRGADRKHVIF